MISCMYKQMLLEDTLLGKFQIVITMFRQLHYCICHRQKSYPISSCKLVKKKKIFLFTKFTGILSGLDAFQAEKVMETLRQLAQDGHSVICSIHQPRGSVYSKFDDIVLLTEGALVYAGPAHEEPLAYFSKFGLLAEPCLNLLY